MHTIIFITNLINTPLIVHVERAEIRSSKFFSGYDCQNQFDQFHNSNLLPIVSVKQNNPIF